MTKLAKRLHRFWSELKRRKTVQTAIAYLIFSAAAVGFASDTLGGLDAPAWILRTVIISLFALFPVVLVVSWIFDFTWHGLERTSDLESEASDPGAKSLAANTGVNELSIDPIQEAIEVPYLDVETGDTHRHQVSILRTTLSLTKDGTTIDDPERIMSLMPEYKELVEAIAEKYAAVKINQEGASFEYLFGYPLTFENDATRAVVMGLAIQEDLGRLSSEKLLSSGFELSAISAVHSSLVVINETADDKREFTILGEAFQKTNWLQSIATPGSIVLDEYTHKLLRDRFECENLGEFVYQNTNWQPTLFRAIEIKNADIDLAVDETTERFFLGRSTEIALVLDRWQRAKEGEDEFVILRGEPGIGKSSIVREVISRTRDSDNTLIMPLFCSPLEKNTPFQPIVEYMLGPGLGLTRDQSSSARTKRIQKVLKSLEIDVERAVPLVASLLSLDSRNDAALSEQARTELIGYLLDIIRATARRTNLVFIIEDLHWADASTLEILDMLVADGTTAGMLCLFTMRPHMSLSWELRSNVTALNLQVLSKISTHQLVAHHLRDLAISNDFVNRVVKEAGGNPLFAEELAKAIYESAKKNDSIQVSDLVLPGTLQRSLASRIDNLGSPKALVQLCSLLGREFSYQLLKSVSQASDEESLRRDLRVLVNAEFLYQQGSIPESRYSFKHILMQETAYQSMLDVTRVKLHKRVVSELEENAEAMPEVMAYHYEGSKQLKEAYQCWMRAAKKSLSTNAMPEAAELANNALRVLLQMPESKERDTLEVQLQAIRGRALLTTYGYAEPIVERTFARALELSDQIGDVPQLFVLLVGLWSYFQIGGSVANATDVATRLVRLSDTEDSPAKKVQSLYCIGYSAYRGGEFRSALEHLNNAVKITDKFDVDYSEFSPSGDDGRLHNLAVLSHINWQLGNDQLAEKNSQDAVNLAERLENPIGIVFASFLRAWLFNLDRNYPQAIEWAKKTYELAKEKQLNFWIGNSIYIIAWASFHLSRDGKGSGPDEELEKMIGFTARARGIGARFGTIGAFIETSEALACNDRFEESIALIDEAESTMTEIGEFYLGPEATRVRAEIARKQNKIADAEQLYRTAIEDAASRDAASQCAYAKERLAHLYESQGDKKKGEEVLKEYAPSD